MSVEEDSEKKEVKWLCGQFKRLAEKRQTIVEEQAAALYQPAEENPVSI